MPDLDRDGNTTEPIPFDFEGDPRVADVDGDSTPVVDMGADEYWVDCNENGVYDIHDIAEGTSLDCDANRVPDECQPDADGDDVPDACESIHNVTQDTWHGTIQLAIIAAVNGDDIEVGPGTYHERINLLGKGIALRGTSGPETTIIDGNAGGTVITCASGEGPDTVIEGFKVTDGEADDGGGMYNVNSSPTLTNCTFSGNWAYDSGGGMYNENSSPTLADCTFSGNSADAYGGGMYNENSSPTLTNCTFSENWAYFTGGGGMGNYGFSAPTLTNCTFTGNSGTDGGGVYNYFSFPTLTNCTFSGNSGDCGSGIHIHYSALTLTNCILWDGGDEVWDEYCSTTTITYSDIQGGWPGEGNIRADPLFVPGPAGCHYLSQTLAGQAVDSPCVDTGGDMAENLGFDTMTTRSDEDTDTGIVDMGYHYPVTGQLLLMGDFDRDADVDLGDFAGLQNCFTGEGPANVSPCCRIFNFASSAEFVGEFRFG